MNEEIEVPFKVFTTTNADGAEVFHFNLLGPIKDPLFYVELFQVLRTAREDNEVHMYLNTPGGRVDTMIQIINCMKNTEANVICHLEALCHSAGTYIFLSGDEFVVNPNSLLLFHNYSSGAFGKGNEIVAEVLASDMWIKQINDDIYYPFLSKDEIDMINSGEDKWMYSAEVIQRLDSVIESREKFVREQNVAGRLVMKAKMDELVAQDEKEVQEEVLFKEQIEEKTKKLEMSEAKLRLIEAQELVDSYEHR